MLLSFPDKPLKTSTMQRTSLLIFGLLLGIAAYARSGDAPASLSIFNGKVTSANTHGNTINVMDTLVKDGYVFMTGCFTGRAIFGRDTVTSKGETDFFVAKYTIYGRLSWKTIQGESNSECGMALDIDAGGNVYATGTFEDSTVFYGQTYRAVGGYDMMLFKYDKAGKISWKRHYGGSGYDAGEKIALDSLGNVYLMGVFTDSIAFGNTTVLGSTSRDICIAKITPAGKCLWATGCGTKNTDEPVALTVRTDGIVIVRWRVAEINQLRKTRFDTQTGGTIVSR